MRFWADDRQAFEDLFARHREYLHLVVQLRMSADVQARMDASDVIQESHLEALRRLDDYLARRPMPFKLWLRSTAQECLIRMRRKHVSAQSRSVEREVALPEQSSVLLAAQALSIPLPTFSGGCSRPSATSCSPPSPSRRRPPRSRQCRRIRIRSKGFVTPLR